MIKKADIILFIVILILGIGLTMLVFSMGQTGSKVLVSVEGEPYGSYPLNQDQTITINKNHHTNKIIIKDGSVSMSSSDCPGQECVKHSPINQTHESIICLPNRVSVTIEGNEGGYDGITK